MESILVYADPESRRLTEWAEEEPVF